MYVITPIYLVFLYMYNIFTGEMPRLYETFFPTWFLFYILGMDCKAGKWDAIICKIKNRIVPLTLGISIIEAFVLLKVGCEIGFASSQIKFSSFIYTIAIALILMKERDSAQKNSGRMHRILSSVGDCSYGIFYVHIFILIVCRKIVALLGLSYLWIVNFALCFVLTASGSYLTVWVVRKLAIKLKGEKYLKIIGF